MAISPEKGGNSVSSSPLMDPLSLIFGEPFPNAGRLKKASFCQGEARGRPCNSMLSYR
jgi:hypothetical protein